jgi:DNA-binding GntR family transcriptional regulator
VASSVEPIQRSPSRLADEAYERLVDALVQGRVGPGDRLIQDRLAEDLDVSRTPVRDALLRLKEEGVIEPAGRRGYVVRRLSDRDVRDLYGARDAVEGHAAAVVAELGASAVDHVWAALEAAGAREHRSARKAFDANRAVHRAVVEATGNAYLLTLFDQIWGRSVAALLAYRDFYTGYSRDEFVNEHRELVEELATGDPVRARQAMLEHIARGLAKTTVAPAGTR